MNDLELTVELQALGLTAETFRAVALLPLIEVAWADQVIQPQERRSILLIAKGHNLLAGDAADVVERWLTTRPSDEAFERGRRVLATLAHRKSGLGADIPETVVDTIVDLCSIVAESAGGLFGMLWTVSPEERRTIRKIAEHLRHVEAEAAGPMLGIAGRTIDGSWMDMLDDLGTDEVARKS